jgi:predicted acyl esterase
VLGAGDHELSPEFDGVVGRVPVPGLGYAHDRVRRVMDHYLKGEDTSVAGEPRVQYYLTGADEWRSADTWPPAEASSVGLYLDSDGHADAIPSDGRLILSTTGGTGSGPSALDRYRYDPSAPADHWVSRNVWEMARVSGRSAAPGGSAGRARLHGRGADDRP